MAKEWTDDEVSALITDSVRIVREDKFETFVRGRLTPADPDKDKQPNAPGNSGNDPGNGNPPTTGRKSLWWGETE